MTDEQIGLTFMVLLFVGIGIWIRRYAKRNPELYAHHSAKTNIGPSKPKEIMSWEGVFYIIWNWKSYAAKTLWLVGLPVVWYQAGFANAILWFFIGGILILMGKFWELIRR